MLPKPTFLNTNCITSRKTRGDSEYNTRGNELQVTAPPTLQRNATMQPKVEKQLAKADLDHGWKQIAQAKATRTEQPVEPKQQPEAGRAMEKPG